MFGNRFGCLHAVIRLSLKWLSRNLLFGKIKQIQTRGCSQSLSCQNEVGSFVASVFLSFSLLQLFGQSLCNTIRKPVSVQHMNV